MPTLSIRYVTPQSRGCERNMSDDRNKLYTEFVGRDVLDGISADNFDSLKNDAFITPDNKEFFEDMLRTGWLSGQISSSGPMPNTGIIQTVSETVSGNVTSLVFRPAAGEVYQLTGASTGSLTGTRIELFISDGVNNVEIGAETAGATQFDPFGSAPIFIDNNVYLNAFLIGGSGTMEVAVSMIRVR
jgi:hypothetical protein